MVRELLTIKQFIEKNQSIQRWPFTEGALRSIYRRRHRYAMDGAFKKIFGRIMVDEEKFYKRGK